jgi:hypothetical protein
VAAVGRAAAEEEILEAAVAVAAALAAHGKITKLKSPGENRGFSLFRSLFLFAG